MMPKDKFHSELERSTDHDSVELRLTQKSTSALKGAFQARTISEELLEMETVMGERRPLCSEEFEEQSTRQNSSMAGQSQ
jgi:hypothetical protein